MGNCHSCLGARRDSIYEDEQNRLLFDDPDGVNYGSFGEQPLNSNDNAQDVQREFEALQSVVARTSDNLVDVFEITPSAPELGVPAPYSLGLPNDRLAQYQILLSKLAGTDEADADVRVEGCFDYQDSAGIQKESALLSPAVVNSGPFVGNFADAANFVV